METNETGYLDFIVEHDSADAGILDLFSTSPTGLVLPVSFQGKRCTNGAPFFAYKRGDNVYGVVQGSCNQWTCPRCGLLVAKEHYGRIVHGARELARDNQLWFVTVTCRGKELEEGEAFDNYLMWTSKLIDACYTRVKRAGQTWAYVQVTEKQKRGHPHSHFLMTYKPHDLKMGTVEKWSRDNAGRLRCENVPALRSEWFADQVTRAGLGSQYDISQVQTVEGASRYVAKYMFKDSQFQSHFPKHWKRVRYSQSYPKLPELKSDAFVLLSNEDWRTLGALAGKVITTDDAAFMEAEYRLRNTRSKVVLYDASDT